MFYIDLDLETIKRYDIAKFLQYENDSFDMVSSYFIWKLKSLSKVGEFFVSAEENRPELISYKLYQDVQYWWLLMMYNDIFNFQEIPAGTIIGYPDLSQLEDLYFNLKSLDTESTS